MFVIHCGPHAEQVTHGDRHRSRGGERWRALTIAGHAAVRGGAGRGGADVLARTEGSSGREVARAARGAAARGRRREHRRAQR